MRVKKFTKNNWDKNEAEVSTDIDDNGENEGNKKKLNKYESKKVMKKMGSLADTRNASNFSSSTLPVHKLPE